MSVVFPLPPESKPARNSSPIQVVHELSLSGIEFQGCDSFHNQVVLGSGDHKARLFEWLPVSPYLREWRGGDSATLQHHQYSINEVRYSPQGSLIACASTDGTTSIIAAKDGRLVNRLVQPSGLAIRCCRFSPDASHLATAGDDDLIAIWDLLSGSLLKTLRGHESTIFALGYSPDSQYLVSADANGALNVWDGQSVIHAKSLCTQEDAHDLGVLTLDFAPPQDPLRDANSDLTGAGSFATGGNDDVIRIWEVRSGRGTSVKCKRVLRGHDGAVMHLRYSHRGTLIASGGGDKVILLWDAHTGGRLHRLEHHERFVTQLAFASNDSALFSVSNDKTLAMWRLISSSSFEQQDTLGPNRLLNVRERALLDSTESRLGAQVHRDQCLLSFPAHASDVNRVCFISSHALVSAGSDKSIKMWSRNFSSGIEDWSLVETIQHHKYPIYTLSFHPERRILVTAGSDGQGLVWDTNQESLGLLASLQVKSGIQVCELSPTGDWIAFGGDDFLVTLWDWENSFMLRSFAGHEASIYVTCFSPNGQYLLSGDSDGLLCLWDVERSERETPIATLPQTHDLGVLCGKASPRVANSREAGEVMFVTGGSDSLVKVWIWSEMKRKLALKRSLQGHGESVMDVSFSQNGDWFATSSGDKTVRVWDANNFTCIQVCSGHTRYVNCCAFGPGDALLATGSNDRHVRIWSLNDTKPNHFASTTISDWTPRNVGDWLQSQGIRRAEGKPDAPPIDGSRLLLMNLTELEEQLGISGRRAIEILQEVQYLRFKNTSFLTSPIPELPHGGLEGVPDEFVCPITQDVMVCPVRCADGFAYERLAIMEWFVSRKRSSPMTNLPLANTQVVEDLELAAQIRAYLHPASSCDS